MSGSLEGYFILFPNIYIVPKLLNNVEYLNIIK